MMKSNPALRRLRKSSALRESLSETKLSLSDVIQPYFVVEGRGITEPIAAMPGMFRFSTDTLLPDLEKQQKAGLVSVLLFGHSRQKDARGSGAYAANGALQQAIGEIKKHFPDLTVYSDVCLCAYTSHGHCGVFKDSHPALLDHVQSSELLAKIALSHADAGVDVVAPSAMMDHQVANIRQALDSAGFEETNILAYAAKYASSFYGPFREAVDSSPQFGDRRTYQMDFRNAAEALREIEQDIVQGADMVMIKPALSYLDIISRAKEAFGFPLAAYNVSGEYSMIKKAAEGNPDLERSLALEVLYSIKRAGANLIITYFAKDLPAWL